MDSGSVNGEKRGTAIDSKITALVLAGAPADDQMKQALGIEWRAEASLAGTRMIDWVTQALRACEDVGRIVVVSAIQCDADTKVKPAGSFVDNLMLGLEASDSGGEDQQVLVVSSDIPLAKPEHYASVIRDGLACDADFAYPVIRKEDCTQAYPEFKRTYQRTKEGTFTGGNVILIDRRFALSLKDRMQSLYEARKKPLKLALMIGPRVLARALIAHKIWPGAVDFKTVETAAGRLLGARLRAFVCEHPEIGEDLDKLEDFAVAEKYLASRSTTCCAAHPGWDSAL